LSSTLSREHSRAITLLSLAAMASGTTGRICDPMLVELGHAFAATPAQTSLVVSGFAVAYGVAQAFFGPLGDRLGKYRLVALTTLACTLGALAALAAQSLGQLVLARILIGITAAGIIPLAMAWIGDTVPYEHRQTTLARYLVGQISGVIAGQFLGGLFTDTVGWRWAFAFLAAFYLVVGLLMLAELRRNALAIAKAPPGTIGLGMVAQMRQVVLRPWARRILLVVFLEGGALFGALALIPSYLHLRFDLELTVTGLVMGLFGLGGLSYTFLSRHLVARFGEAGLSLRGGVLLAISMGMLAFGPHWVWAMPACFLIGIGYYMLHNTLQTNATQMAPEVRGTAVSLFASAFFLGQSAGVALAAWLMVARGGVAVFSLAGAGLFALGLGFSFMLRARLRAEAA